MAPRRLDIKFGLDMTEVARAQAKARADSKKLATDMISDVDAAEKQKLELLKLQLKQGLAESEAARKKDAQGAAQTEKQKSDLLRQQLKEGLRASNESLAETKRIRLEEVKDQEKVNSSIMAGVKSVGSMALAFAGMSSASSIMGSVSDSLDKTHQYATKTAEDIFRIRGLVRELAAMRGDLGSTGPTAGNVLALQSKTLQSTEDVIAMTAQAEGIGQLAIGDTISRADFNKSLEATGKLATMEGGPAEAYGALQGNMLLGLDHKVGPEELQARLERMRHIIAPGAFTGLGQAQAQFGEMNGLVQNQIVTQEQAMGMISAFSLSGKDKAGTRANQFLRATLGAQIRHKGMPMAADLDGEKTDEYMRELGVGKTNDPFVIGDAIAADINKRQQNDPNKNDPNLRFNPYKHLQMHGYGNQEDQITMLTYAGLVNSGKYQQIRDIQNEGLQIGAPGHGVIDDLMAERLKKDTFLQTRQADVAAQLAGNVKGFNEEAYETARKSHFAILKQRSPDRYTKYEDYQSTYPGLEPLKDLGNALTGMGTHGDIRSFTSMDLHKEARRLGVYDDGLTNIESEKALASRIKGAGGDLTGGLEKSLNRVGAHLVELTTELKQARAQKGPPAPIPGKLVEPKLRP
jgi:hypothetical protein